MGEEHTGALPPPWLAERPVVKESAGKSRPVAAAGPPVSEPKWPSPVVADPTEGGVEEHTRKLSRWALSVAPTRPVAPAEVAPATESGRAGLRSVADLTTSVLLRPPVRVPTRGWRRAVHVLSGGAVNPGESPEEVVHRELVARVNVPIRGAYKIACCR